MICLKSVAKFAKWTYFLAVTLETQNCFESNEAVWVEVIVMTYNFLGTIIILHH